MDRSSEYHADAPVTVMVTVKNDTGATQAVAAGIRTVTIDLSSGFHRGLWALQLDKAVGEGRERVVLAAHGVACLAVAWWAQLSPRSYLKNVMGAVFHAPLSLTMGHAAVARSLWPSPATRLPFPSVVADSGSPLVERALELADNWGSRFIAADAPDCPVRSDVRSIASGIEEHLVALLGLFRGEGTPSPDPAAPPLGPVVQVVR